MSRSFMFEVVCVWVVTMTSNTVAEEAYDLKWLRQFGAEEKSHCGGAVFDRDGKIIVSGTAHERLGKQGNGGGNDFIARITLDGSEVRFEQYDTPHADSGGTIISTESSKSIVSSTLRNFRERRRDDEPFGPRSAMVTVLESHGDIVWKHYFGSTGSDFIRSLATDSEENILAAGLTHAGVAMENAGAFDALVVKYTKEGDLAWIRQFGGGGGDDIMGVAVDKADNVFVSGTTQGAVLPDTPTEETNYDTFVRKYDKAGNLIWDRVFPTERQELAARLTIDLHDELLIVERSETFEPGNQAPKYRSSLTKMDAKGHVVWKRAVADKELFLAADIVVDSTGSVFVGGNIRQPMNPEELFGALVMKYSTDGDLVWRRHVPTEGQATVSNLDVDSSGRVLLSGTAVTNDKMNVFVGLLVPPEVKSKD